MTQPADNQPTSNQPADNQPTSNQPTSNRPTSNRPTGNQPAGSEHPDQDLVGRYTAGDPKLDEVTVWSLESHLENCARCRALQADLLTGPTPAFLLDTDTGPGLAAALGSGRDLLERVALRLDEPIRSGPAPTPTEPYLRSLRRRWLVWALLPWTAMTAGVLLAALALTWTAPHRPSLVLLIAPILPLLSVAGTWSRRSDPAWELVAGSPRVGLWLLLRRTAVILLLVIPLLLAAGWAIGLSPALWLLPCLALVLTTLAAGERIGLVPAAAAIWAGWTFTVLLPSLVTARAPAVLESSAAPGWITVILLAAGFIALRGSGFARPISRL